MLKRLSGSGVGLWNCGKTCDLCGTEFPPSRTVGIVLGGDGRRVVFNQKHETFLIRNMGHQLEFSKGLLIDSLSSEMQG